MNIITRWAISGYLGRLNTSARPFRAVVVGEDGSRFDACVKPLHQPSRPAYALAAEIFGGVVGRLLGVPVPDTALVYLERPFLQAVGPELHDVGEGWAVASRWVVDALPLPGLGQSIPSITNPDAVAGVTVLDTLLQNADRSTGNVLLAPVRRPNVHALRFIDHGWGMGAGPNRLLTPGQIATGIECFTPHDSGICGLLTSVSQFDPYLLAGEGLPLSHLASVSEELLTVGWDLGPYYPTQVEAHFRVAARSLRHVVDGALGEFPNLR